VISREPWRHIALDPPPGIGPPLGTGVLRARPEDFLVEEELGFAPAGQGQHLLLKVRKRGANTQWVARELARICGCRPFDVGYAGVKDRHAVAIQWFSVPGFQGSKGGAARLRSPDDWTRVRESEFEVLEGYAHTRKLPRGALAGNRFTIRVRSVVADKATQAEGLAERLAQIARRGVPNYFGPQRFGRDGSNLQRIAAIASGEFASRSDRGWTLSAARSLMFNAVLAERVADGTWERLEPGDLANLDARGSFFTVDTLDDTLRERTGRLDIHPTGPLWGRGVPPSQGRVLELECRIARELAVPAALVEEAGMDQERRSLRLAVRDVSWQLEEGEVVLQFRLARGSFATTVLRELFELEGDAGEDQAEESV